MRNHDAVAVLGMSDGAVQEAADTNCALAIRENAHVGNEEFVIRLKKKAEASPFCIEKKILCVI